MHRYQKARIEHALASHEHISVGVACNNGYGSAHCIVLQPFGSDGDGRNTIGNRRQLGGTQAAFGVSNLDKGHEISFGGARPAPEFPFSAQETINIEMKIDGPRDVSIAGPPTPGNRTPSASGGFPRHKGCDTAQLGAFGHNSLQCGGC